MSLQYDFFDHDADIGIVGRGESLESAFESAACAMFSIMADLANVHDICSIEIEFDEEDPEFALVEWLNGLLAVAQNKRLVLGRFKLHRKNSHWLGKAWGEPWSKELKRGVEVKGATLTMLSVKGDEKGWEARCVVDV